ncbi:hypothetical protein MW887_010557 [Aspergillus wentii]|nr:hypothetical protein MW887_010557 [Aspergillus wentii]
MPKSAAARAAATSNTSAKIMTSETGPGGDASGLSNTLQGHCLTSWFTGGRTNKTCPDCRAPVKSQPTPAYLVRAVVQMFTSRAELLEKGETTAEHTQHQQEEAERLENDKKNTHPKEGGLFRGTFNKKPPVAQPIVDLEDDVVRCPHCSWELEDDSGCAQCGYRQPPDSLAGTESGLSESDENSEMTDYFDDELDDGFAEIDEYAWQGLQGGIPPDHLPFGIPPQLYGLNRRNFHPPFALPLANNPYEWQYGGRSSPVIGDSEIGDSEDEEEEEDYDDGEMDSFIDDDEHVDENDYNSESDRSTVVGDNEYHERDYYHEPQHYRFDASQVDSDVPMSQQGDGSDDSEDVVEEDEDHDDDDDDDDDEEPIRPAVNGPRYNTQRFGPQGNPSGFRPTLHSRMINRSRTENPLQTPRSVGSSANNAISLDDDDDEDEDSDEGPVGPSRRGRDRRNCGRLAY